MLAEVIIYPDLARQDLATRPDLAPATPETAVLFCFVLVLILGLAFASERLRARQKEQDADEQLALRFCHKTGAHRSKSHPD